MAGFGDAAGDNWIGLCSLNYITERGVRYITDKS